MSVTLISIVVRMSPPCCQESDSLFIRQPQAQSNRSDQLNKNPSQQMCLTTHAAYGPHATCPTDSYGTYSMHATQQPAETVNCQRNKHLHSGLAYYETTLQTMPQH